ncbi:MAG TPA: YciI family protein [Micropepsaceae bacterium]|nr:YciI family protein [Micropepsaceae bacterium]
MAYMLLILEKSEDRRDRPKDVGRAAYESMLKFAADLKVRGLLLASNALTSDAHGARVRVRDGRRTIIDGPFAEAKEMVGGYFLLDCKTRAEAIAIAEKCPAVEWATVEVREVGTCFE